MSLPPLLQKGGGTRGAASRNLNLLVNQKNSPQDPEQEEWDSLLKEHKVLAKAEQRGVDPVAKLGRPVSPMFANKPFQMRLDSLRAHPHFKKNEQKLITELEETPVDNPQERWRQKQQCAMHKLSRTSMTQLIAPQAVGATAAPTRPDRPTRPEPSPAAAAAPQAAAAAPPSHRESIEVVLNELVETERAYVKDLGNINEIYIDPLKNSKLITQQEVSLIFSNVRSIFQLNKELLMKIEAQLLLADRDRKIGKIFVEMSPYLSMYKQFCSDQTQSQKTRVRLRACNPTFSKFLVDAQNHPAACKLTLNDFLIKPLQRVCKYTLLLERMKKVMPAGHPDTANMELAITKVGDIVSIIDETKAETMNRKKIMEIEEKFDMSGSDISIVQPGRKYVFDGAFREKKAKGKKRHLYLFNDVIVIARITPKKYFSNLLGRGGDAKMQEQSESNPKKFYIKYVLDLRDIRMQEHGPDSFELDNPDHHIVLWLQSVDEKNTWMAHIAEAMDAHQSLLRTFAAGEAPGSLSPKLPEKELTVNFDIKLPAGTKPVHRLCTVSNHSAVWSADDLGAVKVWDAQSRSIVNEFPTNQGPLFSIISVDEKVWTASVRAIKIWNQNGEMLKELQHECFSLVHMPDTSTVWSGGIGCIKIYSLPTMELTRELVTTERDVFTVMGIVGNRVWCANSEQTLFVWNSQTYLLVREIPQAHRRKINSIVQAYNGFVWTASDDQTIKVWNPKTFELVKKIEKHTNNVCGLTDFHGFTWSYGFDKTILVWDSDSYKLCREIHGHHTEAVAAVAAVYTPQGWTAWSASWDRTVCVLHVSPCGLPLLPKPVVEVEDVNKEYPFFQGKLITGHPKSTRCMNKNLDGTRMWTTDSCGTIKIWDTAKLELVREIKSDQGTIFALESSENMMWSASSKGVATWSETGVRKSQFAGECFSLCKVNHEMWVGEPGSINVYNVEKQMPMKELKQGGKDLFVCMALVAGHVWSSTSNQDIVIWDATTKDRLKDIPKAHNKKINSIIWVDETVWTASDDFSIKVWDRETFNLIETLSNAHGGYVYGMTMLAGFVWSCSWDKCIKIWDAKSRKCVNELRGHHTDTISSIVPVWSNAAGQLQAWSSSWDKTIGVFEVTPPTAPTASAPTAATAAAAAAAAAAPKGAPPTLSPAASPLRKKPPRITGGVSPGPKKPGFDGNASVNPAAAGGGFDGNASYNPHSHEGFDGNASVNPGSSGSVSPVKRRFEGVGPPRKNTSRRSPSPSRRIITSSAPGKVFGKALESLPLDDAGVPQFLSLVCNHLRAKGLNTEGIFRREGIPDKVKALKEQIDSGGEYSFDGVDPVLAATLLKDFLAALPEPVFTFELYDMFAEVEQQDGKHIKTLLNRLPKAHLASLQAIVGLLVKVRERVAFNKMGGRQLGEALGPLMLRPHSPNAEDVKPPGVSILHTIISVGESMFSSEPAHEINYQVAFSGDIKGAHQPDLRSSGSMRNKRATMELSLAEFLTGLDADPDVAHTCSTIFRGAGVTNVSQVKDLTPEEWKDLRAKGIPIGIKNKINYFFTHRT